MTPHISSTCYEFIDSCRSDLDRFVSELEDVDLKAFIKKILKFFLKNVYQTISRFKYWYVIENMILKKWLIEIKQ